MIGTTEMIEQKHDSQIILNYSFGLDKNGNSVKFLNRYAAARIKLIKNNEGDSIIITELETG